MRKENLAFHLAFETSFLLFALLPPVAFLFLSFARQVAATLSMSAADSAVVPLSLLAFLCPGKI
jgi:hypothetical protein